MKRNAHQINSDSIKIVAGSDYEYRSDKFLFSRIILWGIFFVLIILAIWSYLAKIDQVTRVTGQIMTSSRTQIIQASEGGVIKKILVKEGDSVSLNQTLVYFEPTKFESAFFESKSKVAALSTVVDRLKSEAFGVPLSFGIDSISYPEFRKNQTELFNKRKSSINDDISSLKRSLELANNELSLNEPLVKTGDVSLVDVIRLQKQVNEIQSQIINKKNKYLQDVQTDLSKSEEDLSGARQALIQRSEQLKAMVLKAPMDGIVKNIKFSTIGGFLRPGDEIMQLVPSSDDLIVEVKVLPTDIAFIKLGLDANVKIDSYDFSIYGWLTGKVIYISPDSMIEANKEVDSTFYKVRIKINNREFSGKPGEKIDIQPGMTTTAEIKTGENTVMGYLMKPVIKTISNSMNER